MSWILVILSILALSIGAQVRSRLGFIQRLETRQKLRDIADAGVKKAIHQIHKDSVLNYTLLAPASHHPVFFRNVRVGDGYFTVSYEVPWTGETRFGVTDEESKLNLNRVPSVKHMSDFLAAISGIPQNQASDLAAAILDWVDEDDFINSGGAESRYYRSQSPPYEAKNAPMESLAELALVKGMTVPLIQKISPFVTVDGSGKINLNTAPRPVMLATGLPEPLVTKIETFRAGPDGRWGTPDDQRIDSVDALFTMDGSMDRMNETGKSRLRFFLQTGPFGVESLTFTVRSLSRLRYRKEILTLTCMVSEGSVLRCREEFGVLDKLPTDAPEHAEKGRLGDS